MEVYAAADHVDLDAEAVRQPGQDLASVVKELAKVDPDEIEDRTYRLLRFDLCDTCRREVLKNPLGR
jgi:hypothetical protein